MEKTEEQLMCMTHKELVEYAKKMQETNKTLRDGIYDLADQKAEIQHRYDNLVKEIKSVIVVID